MARDQICGMEVNEKKAKFSLASKGKKYYFCSKNCHDKFLEKEKAPILKKTLNQKPLKNKKIETSIKNIEKINKEKKSDEIKKIILPIKGMHCASCAANIEKSLKRVSGVKNANVNYASEKASIEFNAEKASESD